MYKGNMKKIGKMAVICGLCMVLMPMPAGCGSAAKVYVKQQEKDNLTGSEDREQHHKTYSYFVPEQDCCMHQNNRGHPPNGHC